MEGNTASCRGRIQGFPSTVSLEAVLECGNDVVIAESSCTTTGRGSGESIVLDIEHTGGAELEAWKIRVVVWPPLPTHQLEDVMV